MQNQTLQAVQSAQDLLVWLIPQLDKFPRARRYTLGERFEAGVLAILERLIEAAYTRFPSFRRTPESRAALMQFGIQVSPFWVGCFDQLRFHFRFLSLIAFSRAIAVTMRSCALCMG